MEILLSIIGAYAISALFIVGFDNKYKNFFYDQPIDFYGICYICAPITAFCLLIFEVFRIVVLPIVGIEEIIKKLKS